MLAQSILIYDSRTKREQASVATSPAILNRRIGRADGLDFESPVILQKKNLEL
jgi:hypothetical protein